MNNEISSQESILLNLGDLKLSDTENTFGLKKEVDGYIYEPLNDKPYHIISGKVLGLSKIYKEDKNILYAYSSEEPFSCAVELAIGYKKEEQYIFIIETFGDIYSENPKFSSRKITIIDNIVNPNKKESVEVIYFGTYYRAPSLFYHANFANWLNYIETFKEAFTKENLNVLRKKIN